MKHFIASLVGLAAGVAVSTAAQAAPQALADHDMDLVTAGGIDDILSLDFLPGFLGSPAEGHVPVDVPAHENIPDHVFSEREVITDNYVSADGAMRTDLVVSRTIHIDN